MGRIVDAFTGDSKPNREPDPKNYEYPQADELRARYYAIIDGYLKKKGLDAFIPSESRPYELRNDQERAALREEKVHQDSLPDSEFKPDIPEMPDYAAYTPLTQVEKQGAQPAETQSKKAKSKEAKPSALTEEEKGYADAALAATLTAHRMGIANDRPLFTAPREQFQRDEEEKQRGLQQLQDFIYGSRSLGRV